MTEIELARLLFGITASVHYIFVAITLGLTPIIATALTVASFGKRQGPSSVVTNLGRLYVANYGVGIVAGLVMELQMALLWTGAGTNLYAPIASLLALETVVAFFLESTLLGLWLAGRKVLPTWAQAIIFWGITLTAYASAVFIVTANAYLHNPLDISRFASSDFVALLMRPATLWPLVHITASSLVVGAFWCCTMAALALRAGNEVLGRRLIRIGVAIVAVVGAPLAVSGFAQFAQVRPPIKTYPPPWIDALIWVMVITGILIVIITWFAVLPLTLTGRIFTSTRLLRLFQIATAAPMLLILLGWIYRELSRQPWFIIGEVAVTDAASPIGYPLLLTGTILFVALSVITLAVAALIFRRILRFNSTEGSLA